MAPRPTKPKSDPVPVPKPSTSGTTRPKFIAPRPALATLKTQQKQVQQKPAANVKVQLPRTVSYESKVTTKIPRSISNSPKKETMPTRRPLASGHAFDIDAAGPSSLPANINEPQLDGEECVLFDLEGDGPCSLPVTTLEPPKTQFGPTVEGRGAAVFGFKGNEGTGTPKSPGFVSGFSMSYEEERLGVTGSSCHFGMSYEDSSSVDCHLADTQGDEPTSPSGMSYQEVSSVAAQAGEPNDSPAGGEK